MCQLCLFMGFVCLRNLMFLKSSLFNVFRGPWMLVTELADDCVDLEVQLEFSQCYSQKLTSPS